MRGATLAMWLVIVALLGTGAGYLVGVDSRTSQPTNNTTSGTAQPCGNVIVHQSNTSMVPVLLMQPGTIAYACVTYQTYWMGDPNYNWTGSTGRPFGPYQFHPFVISNELCTSSGCSPSITHSFRVSVFPDSVNLTLTTDYVVILYTVTALSNSTGYYSNGVPNFGCSVGVPIVVGHSMSDINSSDFGPIVQAQGCDLPLYPVSVSTSGAEVVYVKPW